jgi:predicted Rossmann fold flavoprotein
VTERVDVAVVGAGAAGLMAAIQARRAHPSRRVRLLDGARTLGAKILVSGGARCNVTHHEVDETAFAGSSPKAIRKVLRRFGVAETVAFFRDLGVALKKEETGKLFPSTDRARTVLDALLGAAREAGVEIRHPWRVTGIESVSDGFRLASPGADPLEASRVVVATGGRSLPKTGSDGGGYALVRGLGHSLTPRIFPGLVPLTLPRDHALCGLTGLSAPATLEVRTAAGRRLASFTGSTLCTHFGLSGPAVLDISRYLIDARLDDAGARLVASWLPGEDPDELERTMRGLGPQTIGRGLGRRLPERLARALCSAAGVDWGLPGHQLTREARRALVRMLTVMDLPVTGDRGFGVAEVTAGGVPLAELDLETMESRLRPGLWLCGEICDVDGRVGGFNFQWAWASGYVAGVSVGNDGSRVSRRPSRARPRRRALGPLPPGG